VRERGHRVVGLAERDVGRRQVVGGDVVVRVIRQRVGEAGGRVGVATLAVFAYAATFASRACRFA
jgi:hypothetical protein